MCSKKHIVSLTANKHIISLAATSSKDGIRWRPSQVGWRPSLLGSKQLRTLKKKKHKKRTEPQSLKANHIAFHQTTELIEPSLKHFGPVVASRLGGELQQLACFGAPRLCGPVVNGGNGPRGWCWKLRWNGQGVRGVGRLAS